MKRNKLFGIMLLIIGLISVFALAGCDVGEGSADGNTQTSVYIAGTYNNGACYWKNGERIDLSTADSRAVAIAVADSDVYVAGEETYSACYWKNGKKIDLEGFNTQATAIAVVGPDVYIAGYSYVENDNYSGTRRVACYWKNGTRTDLQISAGSFYSSRAHAIAVAGSDVYVAGEHNSYASSTACYWKNGERIFLTYPSSGRATAIVVVSPDIPAPPPTPRQGRDNAVVDPVVHVAGYYSNNDISNIRACYWKNEEKTDLPFPFSDNPDDYDYTRVNANAIAVAGPDVYIAGSYEAVSYENSFYENSVCYWKNGERIKLEGLRAVAVAIAVAGSDVYVAGSYQGEDGERACYWINGKKAELSDGYSCAAAIAVVVE